MIHAFKNGHWLPGPDHRDGNKPFPEHPEAGVFFNDVSGLHGRSIDEVAENLPELLMKQGTLAELLKTPFDWRGFMGRIQKRLGSLEKAIIPMVDVVVRPDESLELLPHDGWDAALMEEAGRLAVSLIQANGQMDFIRRQPWFKDGSHRVELHVMTQWGRRIAPLQFHKDSKGEELFSNLVFRHDEVIPATEWSVDLENMPAEKVERLEDCWPPMLLADIDQARLRLAARAAGRFPIEGGKLQPDSYMSWVDELVWHSTPSLEHRPRYSLDQVHQVLADPGFTLHTYDILVQLARLPDGHFASYLAENEVELDSLNGELAGRLFDWSHTDEDFAFLRAGWAEDANAIAWSDRPQDTAVGVAMIRVKDASPDHVQMHQPTGLVGRPRSNSHNLQELLALQGGNQPRNMLAVFVRVRPSQ